jgi:hypothetical protein
MADNKLQDASWDLVNSVREANQAVATTTVTILDRNLKFAQSTYLSAIEVLEGGTNDMSNLAQAWGQQIQRQQEAFQKLASGTMDTYMNFLRVWFSFSQQAWGVTRSTVDREFQVAQETAHRAQGHSQ